MKRFIFSAFSVVLVAGALAPTAQALPQVDPAFKLQTLRLREFDARNKSEDGQKPYNTYEQQTTEQPNPQTVTVPQEKPINADSTTDRNTDTPSEANDQPLALTARRQASLDHN